MKAIAEVYTECQLDKAERFLKKLVTGLAPRSKKQGIYSGCFSTNTQLPYHILSINADFKAVVTIFVLLTKDIPLKNCYGCSNCTFSVFK